MGPWPLPPHSTNVWGFGHGPPSCGVKEGCDPPLPVPGSHRQMMERGRSRREGAKGGSHFPHTVPSRMFGQGSARLPGLVQALPAVARTSSARTVGVWGLWTHLQSWRVLVLLSRTDSD